MRGDLLDRHLALRVLVYLATVIAALYAGGYVWAAMAHFGDIILLFFLAWVISFILGPLVGALEGRGVPRVAAVSATYAALAGVVAGSIVLAIPTIHAQAQALATEVGQALAPGNLQGADDGAVRFLRRLGLGEGEARALLQQVLAGLPAAAGDLTNRAVALTTSLLGAVALLLFDAVLVLVLSFYMMLDGGALVEGWVRKLPPAWLPDVRLLQRHVEVIFGGFLRAQLIVALTYGFLTWLVLALLGQPNGLVFAVVAAFLMLIPFVGPFLAVLPPLTLVLLQSPSGDLARNAVFALIGLAAAQQVTLQVVAPRLMSAHIGLHPLLLFAALLVGVKEGGVWGALFAGPIAAVAVAMLATFLERFRQVSALYRDPGLVSAERDGDGVTAPPGPAGDAATLSAPAGATGRRYGSDEGPRWAGRPTPTSAAPPVAISPRPAGEGSGVRSPDAAPGGATPRP